MFQPGLLKDRAIFLTGGGTGLGRSMALHFAKLGARLFVVGRREEPLKSTCDEIHREGGAAAFATCDVRDFSAVDAAFAAAELQFGEIDTLVNNAAGNFMARTEKLSLTPLTPSLASSSTAPFIARKHLPDAASKKNLAATFSISPPPMPPRIAEVVMWFLLPAQKPACSQ